MEREKVLDRVQKLLALATSPNEHEAAAAAAQAQALLHRYQLTLADVQQRVDYKGRKLEFPVWWTLDGRRQFAEHLATVVVNAVGAVPMQHPSGWLIFGEPGLVIGAELLLIYLFDVVERTAVQGYRERVESLTDPYLGRHPVLDEPGDRQRWLHGYLFGVIQRLAERFMESRRATAQEVADGSGVALAVVSSALVKQHDEAMAWLRARGATDLRAPLNAGRVHSGALQDGVAAADQLPLQAPKGVVGGS